MDLLQDEFTSLDQAIDVACATVDEESLLHAAALHYVFTNAPEEVRDILRRSFDKVFNARPDYRGPNGERFYSVALAAKMFGLTVDEVRERAGILETVFGTASDVDGIARVQ